MLADRGRARAAVMVESTTLDRTVLGVARASGESGMRRLRAMPESTPWIDALAAWELDRGTAADAVERLTPALVLSNEETTTLRSLLETRRRLRETWGDLGVAARKRLASTPMFARSCDLLATEASGLVAEIRQDTAALRSTGLAPKPFLTGEDLKAMGLEAGPVYGRILTEVYDAQLEGRLHDREEAMALARELGEASAGGENDV